MKQEVGALFAFLLMCVIISITHSATMDDLMHHKNYDNIFWWVGSTRDCWADVRIMVNTCTTTSLFLESRKVTMNIINYKVSDLATQNPCLN